jgi:hypothetical protein
VNWQSCRADGTDCTYVASTNELEYTLTRRDEGRSIRVHESAGNSAGTSNTALALAGPVRFDDTVLPSATVRMPLVTSVGRVTARWTPIAGLGSAAAWELLEERSTIFARQRSRSSRTTRVATFSIAPGETLCVRVRAITELGTGAWSAPACTSGVVSGRGMTARGRWTDLRAARTTRTRGASLELRVVSPADRIVLVAARCATCGTIIVEGGGRTLRRISLAGRAGTATIALPRLAAPVRGLVRIRVVSAGRPVTIHGVALATVQR